MSETVTKAETSKARGVKDTAGSHEFQQFEMPQFEFPKFDMPKLEMPAFFRDATVEWLDQSKTIFDAAIEETSGVCGQSWSSAAKCMADCAAKLAEAMHRNADTAFGIAHRLAAAKSMPEIVEISTNGARRQYQTLVTQNQELWSLAQASATEVVRPFTSAMPKALRGVVGIELRGGCLAGGAWGDAWRRVCRRQLNCAPLQTTISLSCLRWRQITTACPATEP